MAARVTLKANAQLREYMKNKRVVLWQLADELNTTEATVCRRLRHELSAPEATEMRAAIDRAALTHV